MTSHNEISFPIAKDVEKALTNYTPPDEDDIGFIQPKDIYINSSNLDEPHLNVGKHIETEGMTKNAIIPQKYIPSVKRIYEEVEDLYSSVKAEDPKRTTFRILRDAYQLRISRTIDHFGDTRISARMISKQLPRATDPKWNYDPFVVQTVSRWLNTTTGGYFLVFGRTGSGKTVLMSGSITDWIADAKTSGVIRTAEYPVEFIYPTSTPRHEICQWEVEGENGWGLALNEMVRTNPDIASVAEIRTPSAVEAFLSLASAGPIAQATYHGNTPGNGLRRIYNMGKATPMGEAIKDSLSGPLLGVLHQSLVRLKSGGIRPFVRILDATLQDGIAIKTSINDGNFAELDNISDRQAAKRKAGTIYNDTPYEGQPLPDYFDFETETLKPCKSTAYNHDNTLGF